jgi:hypothetical protein
MTTWSRSEDPAISGSGVADALADNDQFQEAVSNVNAADGTAAAVNFIHQTLSAAASVLANQLVEAEEDEDEDEDPS